MRHPRNWFDAVSWCHRHAQGYVLITVLTVAGSVPREQGTKMVVTGDRQFDTIGGGHLEFDAVKKARTFLATGQSQQHIESYPLSSKLGQCCGGAVKVLFEINVSHCQTLAIFGAGHVAQALIPVLAQLPLNIKWIDSRPDAFSELDVPPNVTTVCDPQPEGEIPLLPAQSWLLILTHDHQLDYLLAETALKINQFPYVGMIGSDTKARRFRTKLAHRGLGEAADNHFVSPVGNLAIPGKTPIEVAVSVSAQIIERLHSRPAPVAPDVTQSRTLENDNKDNVSA